MVAIQFPTIVPMSEKALSIITNCCFVVAADVCETSGTRELAAQALFSMDSPNGVNESRTFLQSLVPNGDTSTVHSTSQCKSGE